MCLFSGKGLTAFHSPRWCNDLQHLGGGSPRFISPLCPSFAASTTTHTKPVSSCRFTRNFTWNTFSHKTTGAAGELFSLTNQHPKVVSLDKSQEVPGKRLYLEATRSQLTTTLREAWREAPAARAQCCPSTEGKAHPRAHSAPQGRQVGKQG